MAREIKRRSPHACSCLACHELGPPAADSAEAEALARAAGFAFGRGAYFTATLCSHCAAGTKPATVLVGKRTEAVVWEES